MRYSIGTGFADFGFTFLEKIHEPIFLIHRAGKIVKANEAGRKFLQVLKISNKNADQLVEDFLKNEKVIGLPKGCLRLKKSNSQINLIVRTLQGSDYLLAEVKRSRRSMRP